MADEFDIILSNEVIREVNQCGEPKRQKMIDMLEKIEYDEIEVNGDIVEIANKIILLDILKEKNRTDCLHIGCAIYTNCELLLSWNFADLANPKTNRGILSIGLIHMHPVLEIISPFNLNLKEIK